MRNRRTKAMLLGAAAGGALLAPACTGGPGPLPSFQDNYDSLPGSRENPGAGFESPGAGRESPATNREIPPRSTDPSPASGRPAGGATGTTQPGADGGIVVAANGCPPCDVKLSCQYVSGAQTKTDTLSLSLKNGVCSLGGNVVLECDGTIAGGASGTWRVVGGALNLQLNGVSATCTLGSNAAGGASGSSDAGTRDGSTVVIEAGAGPTDAAIGG